MLAILLPAAGILASFALGGRNAERIALGSAPIALAIALAVLAEVLSAGRPIVYVVAGVAPPLGIALRADGLSAVMLVTSALILPAAGLFARAGFATPPGAREQRKALTFWIMLQAISAALAIIFVSGDLFNLYVALELLTFAAVPLACVDGRAETFAAALRYLLFALFGSIFYLLGAALLYGAFGTLDIALLAERIRPLPAVTIAAALMTAGLLAKTALFPLHLWLPPAHANAPAPASAVLSGLVVKGSFFLVVRLWFFVLPALPAVGFDAILGALGSAAVVFGSVLALRQPRLKLLIAYSTIAQIGYLFLIFPLGSGAHAWTTDGWNGGLMQVLAHAFAKSAMFLAAGLLYELLGHDQNREFLRRRARDADDVLDPRPRRPVADGPAAERRLRGEMAADARLRRLRPMGLGARAARGRPACGGLCLQNSRAGARRRSRETESPAAAGGRGDRADAGAGRGRARLRAGVVLSAPRHRPAGAGDRGAAMMALGPFLLMASLAVADGAARGLPVEAPAPCRACAARTRADPGAHRRARRPRGRPVRP